MSDTAKPIPKPEVVKKVTVLERLKKLDEERSKLLEDAKTEALKKAQDAVDELNSIGFSYRLVEGGEDAPKRSGGKGIKRQKSVDTPCGICKFVTDPPHDGRQHRNQDPKKPFTAKELENLGLTKKA